MGMPVEGTDYLFNRYAFLGVAEDADAATIDAAIKQKKSENHPDRYQHTSEEARTMGEKLWATTEQCESILTDADKRAAFDERLAWFRAEKPDVISEDGRPMISLKYTRVSLDGLLGEMPSIEKHEKLVEGFVNFQPRQVTIMERAYREDPDDVDTREAYRAVLVNGMLHYDLSQEGVWDQAGVQIGTDDRQSRVYLEDVTDGLKERVQEIGDTIAARVQEHYGLLSSGLAAPLRLSGPIAQAAGVEENAVIDAEQAVDIARQHFNQRTHRLEQLASKQQEMMGKLLDTMQIWPINEAGTSTEMPHVALMRKDEHGEMRCLLTMGVDNGAITLDQSSKGKTVEELKADAPTTSTVAMETHDEIRDYAIYMTFLFGKLQREKEGQTRA